MVRFEGPEKKLEIILSSPPPGLRDNADQRWTRVVRASGAAILNCKQTPRIDAYLLSESSLFVWDDRLLLITCGQTSPVTALPVLLEFVDRESIDFLFYERKRANFPEDQPRNFSADEQLLREHLDGRSTRLGGAEHPYVDVFYYAAPSARAGDDTTLQVLMHDLDPEVGSLFGFQRRGERAHRRLIERICGLADCRHVDSHLFYPQGYSLNAVDNRRYFTVHVTPQPEGSYASVETNGVAGDIDATVREAVDIFRPGKVSVVLTESCNGHLPARERTAPLAAGRYRMADGAQFAFDHNYLSTYLHYLEET